MSDKLTENMGPFALGTGIATLAISLPFMAVAVDLISTAAPVHWALRVVLFLFTLPFVLIGGALLVSGFGLLVNDAVPGSSPVVLRAPKYLLLQMAKPRHLVAALPVGFVSVQYYLVLRTGGGHFGVGEDLLESGILVEFIAIHATGVLGAATLIPDTGRLRIARLGTFALLAVLYVLMGSAQGWEVALSLAFLVAVKLGPFLLGPPDLHTGATLGLRWGFHMVVFLSVFTFFGGLESLRAGTIYWTFITLTELLGMTEAKLFHRPSSGTSGGGSPSPT